MPDKPNLFQKLFRKTKDNLEKNKGQNQGLDNLEKPAQNNQSFKQAPKKTKIPLTGGKIETYKVCPKKFQYAYLNTSGKGQPRPTSPHLSFDTAIHYTLKAFYKNKKADEHFKLEKLLQLLISNWDNRGFDNPEQEREFKLAAEKGLKIYFEKFSDKPAESIEIDYFFKVALFGGEYSGKMDRVDRMPDGTIEIIDYKTGKPPVGGVEELGSTLSLQLLFLAGDVVWPGKTRKITIIYIRDGTVFSIFRNPTLLNAAKKGYLEISDAISQGKFQPLRSPACSYCDYRDVCPLGSIPSLNPSKIRTFLECPYKYQSTYLSKPSAPKRPEEPSLDLTLDRALHEALSRLHTCLKSTENAEPRETMYQVFYDSIPKELPEEASIQLKEQGREFLDTYFNEFYHRSNVKYVNDTVMISNAGYEFQAILDRVDENKSGEIEIVDYKSGKKVMEPGEILADPVTAIVCAAAARKWPGKAKRFSHIYLRSSKCVTVEIGEYLCKRGNDLLEEIADKIAKKEFEALGGPSCGLCKVGSDCRGNMLTVSISKINSFLSCPLKYKMNYIDRIPKEARPTPHLNFDRSIHFALREFHERLDKKTLKASPFRSILADNWIDSGYSDWDELQRFKNRAQLLLDDYFNKLSGLENPIMFETTARWSIDNLDVAVQIDRVDELSDGKLEIIDYKTGKKIPDERVLSEDMTLMNLFLAANQRWPGKVAKATYHFISAGKKLSLSPNSEQIESHTKKMKELAHQIESADFEPNKGALCNWCEFYGPCPEWKVKPYMVSGETQEQFRKRMRMSYSKMSLFLNCPRSYKKLYIDRVPPKPRPFFSFGTTIHETFEIVYDPDHPRQKPNLQELLQIYEDVRAKHREGFASEEIEEKYHQDGIRQVTLYYNRFLRGEFRPAHSIEDYFEIPCGKYAVMTGFIDRIDRLDDGRYEILDYKTEHTDRTQEEVDQDKQLSIYYWACEHAMNLKISKLSLFMLNHDKKITTIRTRDDIPHVVERIDETAYQMLNEKEFAPKKNKYCRSCDHLHDCPLKDEVIIDKGLISMKKF